MVDDPDAQVRLQLACTLGEWNDPRAGESLGQLLLKDSANIYIAAGAYSSINDKNLDSVVRAVMSGGKENPAPQEVIATLLKIGSGMGNSKATATLLAAVTQSEKGNSPPRSSIRWRDCSTRWAPRAIRWKRWLRRTMQT